MSRRRIRALLPIAGGALLVVGLMAAPSAAATSHQPVVSSVSPASGPLAGGTKITIHGTHLSQTQAVLVGGGKATHVHVVSASTVTATAPHHPAGSVHIRVKDSHDASDQTAADTFTYVHAPSVSRVGLTNGSGRNGSTVRITGQHLSGATRVRFGSTPAVISSVHHGTITATVPKHAPGLLDVTVSTAGGTSAKQADDVYPMPTPISEQWSSKSLAYIEKNDLAQVACATTTHCVAVDRSDSAWTIDNGVWSDPVTLPKGKYPALPSAISCPTTDFCVVAGNSHLYTFEDGAWALGPELTDSGLHGISCASSQFCVATTAHSYRTYDGTWSDAAALPANTEFNGVSCYAVDACIAAVSAQGDAAAYKFDGSMWTLMDGVPAGSSADQVSCASSTLCALVTGDREVSVWNGTSWSAFDQLDGQDTLHARNLTCVASSCYYETASGVYAYTGGSWTLTGDDAYDLVGCASATNCVGEDDLGHIGRFDATSWNETSEQLARIGPASSLSCPSANFCALTDLSGNGYTFDGTDWTGPVKLADTFYEASAVSCPKPTFCLATFGDRTVAKFDGENWSAQPHTVHPETSLACFSAHLCLASGQHYTEQFDGDEWTVVATGGPWLSMSCPAPTFCAATTPDSVQFWDGDNWHTTLDDPNMQYTDVHGISCASADFCLVVDGQGYKYAYRDGAWSDPEPTLWFQQLSVDCYSTTFCEAIGEYGEQSFDGHYWSAVGGAGAEGLYGTAPVACYGEGTCRAAWAGTVYTSEPV